MPVKAVRMRNTSAMLHDKGQSRTQNWLIYAELWVRSLGEGIRVEYFAKTMATGAETAVTTQPRSKRKEIEQFVRDLDPLQVVGEPA